MKTEKRCDNCKYGKIDTRNTLPILCLKSIKEVKSKHCIRYSRHSEDDNCRKWESREVEECDFTDDDYEDFSDETENC